jgi:hypothetical protein
MATFAMCCKVTLPATTNRPETIILRRISEISIISSWKNRTDTAEIVIPWRTNVKGIYAGSAVATDQELLKDKITTGDPVIIEMGYNGDMYEEFRGYITDIDITIPIKIKCEDEMYHLKKGSVGFSSKNAKLRDLLKTLTGGKYEIVCDDISIGTVRYSKMAPVQILDDLRKHGIHTFFQDGKLYGMQISDTKSNNDYITIVLEKCAENNLKKKQEIDWLIRVIASQRGKKPTIYEYGEKGGSVFKTESLGVGLTHSEIEALAKRLYDQMKHGNDGGITLFGIPRVTHGMRIQIKSIYQPSKEGIYYIDGVTKKLSTQGYRQILDLGSKAI